MKHEAVTVLTGQCIDFLFVARGAECGHHQRLRLTTGEQGRTVGARQYAATNRNRTNSARIATIDTWLAIKNLRANNLRLQTKHDVADFRRIWRGRTCRSGFLGQLGGNFRMNRAQLVGTRLLFLGAERITQLFFSKCSDARNQRLVLRRR